LPVPTGGISIWNLQLIILSFTGRADLACYIFGLKQIFKIFLIFERYLDLICQTVNSWKLKI